MAALKGTLSQILVNEFNFSGETSGIAVNADVAEAECTNLASVAGEYEALLPTMRIEQNGYLSGVTATGTLEAELKACLGVGGVYVAALAGTHVTACPAYVLDGTYGASMQITSPANGLITLNGAWGVGRGGHRGMRVYTGTITGTGAQAAIDIGSAGSAGGSAYLFVHNITGSATNADFRLQSATAQAGTYADEATFTFSNVGGHKQALSGTVNRWLRLSVTGLGGATAIEVTLIACVKGVTE